MKLFENLRDRLQPAQPTGVRTVNGVPIPNTAGGRRYNTAEAGISNIIDSDRGGGKPSYLLTSEQKANQGKYKDWKKGLKEQGYRLEARPYEFNTGAFQNPYMTSQQQMLNAGLQARASVETPEMQAARINQQQQNQFRNMQGGLANQLYGQMTGQAPSLAQMQLQQGLEQQLAGQRALAASNPNTALGFRNAQSQMGNIGAQTNATMAQARLAEQLQAQQALGGVLGTGREQDIGLATSQAALQQQASQQNLDAQIKSQALLDDMTKYYLTSGMSLQQAQWQANMDLEQMRGQQHAQAQGTAAQYFVPKSGGGVGGAMSGIGALAGGLLGILSDVRVKENIQETNPFMSRVNAMDALVQQGYNPEMQATQNMAGWNNQMNNPMMNQMKNRAFMPQYGAMALGGLGSILSDVNAKKAIKKDIHKVQDFMNKIKPYQYNYKGESSSEKRVGVMAQDMEKSEIGKGAVFEYNGYKAIDAQKALSIALASIANLNKRD